MSLSTKVLFFCFSSLLLLPCQKTLVFRFFFNKFSSNIEKFSAVGLEFFNITFESIAKISIQEFYDTETTIARRKQKNKTLIDRK